MAAVAAEMAAGTVVAVAMAVAAVEEMEAAATAAEVVAELGQVATEVAAEGEEEVVRVADWEAMVAVESTKMRWQQWHARMQV